MIWRYHYFWEHPYCAAIAQFIADSAGYPGQPQKQILADGGGCPYKYTRPQ